MNERPRLLIVCEFEHDGHQYARRLGLPSRHAFRLITGTPGLIGRSGEIYRVCGLPRDDVRVLVRRMVAAGQLREATDEDVATVIAVWEGER